MLWDKMRENSSWRPDGRVEGNYRETGRCSFNLSIFPISFNIVYICIHAAAQRVIEAFLFSDGKLMLARALVLYVYTCIEREREREIEFHELLIRYSGNVWIGYRELSEQALNHEAAMRLARARGSLKLLLQTSELEQNVYSS